MTPQVAVNDLSGSWAALMRCLESTRRRFESAVANDALVVSDGDLESEVTSNFGPDVAAHFQLLRSRFYAAIVLARQLRLDAAVETLNAAARQIPRDDERVRALCLTFMEAAAAYVEYKKGDLCHAHDRVIRAMEIDTFLETATALSVLRGHRVQLLHNLARIERRKGRLETALRMLAHTVEVLHGVEAEYLTRLPGDWSAAAFATLPRSLRQSWAEQVTSEASLILAAKPEAPWRSEYLRSIVASRVPVVSSWAAAKIALASAALARFCARAQTVLLEADPARASTVLWFDVVLDARDFGPPEFAACVDAQYLRSLPGFPAEFCARLLAPSPSR